VRPLTPAEAEAVAALLRAARPARSCEHCKERITRTSPQARYCSPRCQRAAARLRALAATRAAPPPTREQVEQIVEHCRTVASYSYANSVRPLEWEDTR
jgi:hypothetical protein